VVHSRQGKWCLEASCCGGRSGIGQAGRILYPKVPPDFSTLKRSMIEKNPPDCVSLSRRSCGTGAPERCYAPAAFVRFSRSDLAVFADGLRLPAAEQQSLREQIEAKIGC